MKKRKKKTHSERNQAKNINVALLRALRAKILYGAEKKLSKILITIKINNKK